MHGMLNLKITPVGTLVREKQHHRIDECRRGEAQVGGDGNDAGAESQELAVNIIGSSGSGGGGGSGGSSTL
jgi:hypothetical protein